MARYDVMVRCTVEAESVEAAEYIAQSVVGRLSNGHKFFAEVVFPDGEDNDGQRVYYLHPANVDADSEYSADDDCHYVDDHSND